MPGTAVIAAHCPRVAPSRRRALRPAAACAALSRALA